MDCGIMFSLHKQRRGGPWRLAALIVQKSKAAGSSPTARCLCHQQRRDSRATALSLERHLGEKLVRFSAKNAGGLDCEDCAPQVALECCRALAEKLPIAE